MKSMAPSPLEFIAYDRSFRTDLLAVAQEDPLRLHEDNVHADLQGSEGPLPLLAIRDTASRLTAWAASDPSPSEALGRIVRRDVDKAIGACVVRKMDTAELLELQNALAVVKVGDIPTPRADFYGYTFGSSTQQDTTYTGDPKERSLLELMKTSLEAAHEALYHTLHVRDHLRHGHSDDAAYALTQLESHMDAMHRPMIDVYRAVGPDFVANQVTRFLGAALINGDRYEGPNASHSAYMVLDRFVLGSFEPLFIDHPELRKQFEFRKADIPLHLQRVMDEADASADDESLVELTQRFAPHLLDAAVGITTKLRKFKVVHKSYADKGLAAKGKELNPDEPDVLSDNIAFTREKERVQ